MFPLGAIISIAQAVPSIVSTIQRAFGKEPGAVRKAAAMTAAQQTLAIINGLSPKDVNEPAVLVLLDELIEIGVAQKKLAQRMAEIDDQLKTLVAPPSAPEAPTPGAAPTPVTPVSGPDGFSG